jgi:hypothetical protein
LVVLRTGEMVRLVSVFKVSHGLQFQSMTHPDVCSRDVAAG